MGNNKIISVEMNDRGQKQQRVFDTIYQIFEIEQITNVEALGILEILRNEILFNILESKEETQGESENEMDS